MVVSGSEFIRSPGIAAWVIFWIYAVFATLGGYSLARTFKKNGILVGHFNELFRFLTRVRIWSLRYRKTYTLAVTGVLLAVFLVLVYWAEVLHAAFYPSPAPFSGVVDYATWILVFVVSGLQQGQTPNSILALLLAGVFPFVVLGSIVTIVRYTSEQAHDTLVKQMAEGQIGAYRVLIFNYHEKYDGVIRSILDRSDAFVVIFAKESNLQDARSFIDGLEDLDSKEYRTKIERLSYSEDLLFEQYDAVGADELYILPDTNNDTDYENVRLVTELNRHVSDLEDSPNRRADTPSTVWLSDSRKLAGVSDSLADTRFREHLHAVSFQTDIRDLMRLDVATPVRELDAYYHFDTVPTPPEWIRGYRLSNYTFHATPLSDSEHEALAEIRAFDATDARWTEATDTRRVRLKRDVLSEVEARLRADLESGDRDEIGILYGLLSDISGTTVPIRFADAHLNPQMETATASLQVAKERHVEADTAAGDDTPGDGAGDVFVVNLNDRIREFVFSFGQHPAERGRNLTVYNSAGQVTPELSDAVNAVQYDSISELLEMLFHETDKSPRTLEAGDKVVIALNHTVPDPEVNILRILDAIDDRLRDSATGIDHTDVFLAVESDTRSHNGEYRYLSVDKVLRTHETQLSFLHNIVQFRHSEPINGLIQEGKLTRTAAVNWAVETAHYLRKFRVDRFERHDEAEAADTPPVDGNADGAADGTREDGRLPLTTLSLQRDPESAAGLTVELSEPTGDDDTPAGEFLLSFPRT
ncbi:hypothetical protein GCM10008995_27010 [Halobellus salinus]|uniref:Uncharacterized protein n=1 Tax=Halobellus salinus TaxID=931585 RepID=A0A830EVX8_9EURY|nr:hypothetical protein [Halobellus salinus]GGJ15784.1 hypothetical protein GCM10008995_27010 [Halobellus salinus]SMP30371.1 hypothetical protein SAMN06265347_11626 [Halobellus salinus]